MNKILANVWDAIKPSISSPSSFDGDGVVDTVTEFTPRGFVSGFITPPSGVKPLEAIFHSAAVALETERIRVVYHETQDGVYFLAADANDFINNPNAKTALAAALPSAVGHQGDGAYFIELGSGIVAVVLKNELSLQSYIGERSDAIRFAGANTIYWPTESESWTGLAQFESRQARRIAKISIIMGMTITALCLGGNMAATAATAFFSNQKEATIQHIRTQQQNAVSQLNAPNTTDAYAEYRKLSSMVVSMDGKLIRFESNNGVTTWDAEFPAWVSDLSKFGPNIKMKSANGQVAASKGI